MIKHMKKNISIIFLSAIMFVNSQSKAHGVHAEDEALGLYPENSMTARLARSDDVTGKHQMLWYFKKQIFATKKSNRKPALLKKTYR
jgi:hypothetical protein